MSTTEAENKDLIRRLNEEVWKEGNLDLVDELVAEDYVEHNPAVPHEIRGREAYKQNVQTFHTAFPDLTFVEEDVIAEGDTVVTRITARGTHEGELMGIEPTGKEVEVAGMDIHRIEDGTIAEAWIQVDMMGLMQQLGVVEPPGA